jgi:peroxiredoxin-like protein
MADLDFPLRAIWPAQGEESEGVVTVAKQTFTFSSPKNMGGKGVGQSPEDFLVAGVASCYTATLFKVLMQAELPVDHVEVDAKGIVTEFPDNKKFSGLEVSPTIFGGDTSRLDEYKAAAEEAHLCCFIGKTIAGNVDYRVGTVAVG